ncbi:MAG: metalloregulator ArsR/SmtB family transcription factor [Gammaproteobacteria bacterium]|jgi:DNA-binding transcriptional ArsR family regulator|uniref:ArsR family transcriptional regulator n=1 Tax=Thioalbus denitrificans TaxID=547122 RepID=A0A369BQK7_9GAMM|nr:metalloregulator ArsR/SmtB family transcription factor [Thioalbus denitrificans]MDD3448280.1 metalloregulator ArsR/SmtB family transcription factor [Gammaproteobacteria bacterium]RCX23912.1 ArsR family transcriptional regulator [Thioalbus denitrificans]
MSDIPEIDQEDDPILTANALKAMAHPVRWRILCALGEQELTVQEILDRVGTTQSNISQHLEVLRSKHIVSSRKEGTRVYCRVRNKQLQLLIENMRDVLCVTNLEEQD